MTPFREGVFFDLPAEEYHSVPALSASGIKWLRMSRLDYYVRSPWNPRLAEVLEEEGSTEARDLGTAFHKRIIEGREAFDSCYAAELEQKDFPNALRTMDDLKARLKELELKVSGSKADLIARLFEADPKAQVWDEIVSAHGAEHSGKKLLAPKWMDKIEIAAAMIEKHPQLSKAFSGGAPEVSIFWVCPDTGVQCKARLDYLKPKAIVDLKTLAPQPGTPLNRAVAIEFARRRYFVQAAFYAEAAAQVAGFLNDGMTDACQSEDCGGCDAPTYPESLEAGHPKTFLFVFQVKGVAPVAMGRTFPAESITFQAAKAEIDAAKMLYKTCLEKFGPDTPWVDTNSIEPFLDEEVPPWALT